MVYTIYKNTYANAPRNIWIEKIMGILLGWRHVGSKHARGPHVYVWGGFRGEGTQFSVEGCSVYCARCSSLCCHLQQGSCGPVRSSRVQPSDMDTDRPRYTLDSLSKLAMSPFLSVCSLLFSSPSRSVLVSWPSCSDSGSPCWLSLLPSDQVRGRRARLATSASSLALQEGVSVS